MMPLAPTPIMPIPTKPKIGFSIDSIVGSNNNTGFASMKNKHGSRYSPNSEGSDRAISPGSDASYNNDSMVENNRTLVHSPSAMTDLGRGRIDMPRIGRLQSPSRDPSNRSPDKMYGSQMLSPNRSTPSPKHPILVPGIPANIIRPNPMGPLGMPGELKPMQYMNSQEIVNAHNQHFLAAQFQVAAAAALAHNAQHQGAQNAFAHAQGVPPHAQGVPRDSYPLYPWLLSRHGRIFPHRFPGGN